jgi:outer membrane protein OmpA-like peptidoglycan-associated protein
LKSDAARKLQISGHTDALGAEDYNKDLSRRRAEVVTSTLKSLGVNATQIVETGMGASLPLDPNRRQDGTDNPEGRSRNRRTEIYLDF